MAVPSRVVVFGAGSVGCYLGGRLAAGGAEVTFVGRARVGEELAAHGLQLTDLHGGNRRVDAANFTFHTEAADCARNIVQADVVVVSVKSADTAETARQLRSLVGPNTIVLAAQNGIGNADVLRETLADAVVLAAMVPFNVVRRGDGVFHQGSEGQLEAQAHPALYRITDMFAEAGLPIGARKNFHEVQWGKLLLNLNNPVNALSGLALRDELAHRPYRQVLALAQTEALHLLAATGVRPARVTPLPARWLPRILSVPDVVFRILGRRMLAIDPLARSSMWEDLEAGRRTEVDWISGEVVRLAERSGSSAPVNARLVELIRQAESGGNRRWSGEELWEALHSRSTLGKRAG